MNYPERLDPVLKDVLGDEENDEQPIGGDVGSLDDSDPVGNFRHLLEYGIPAEGARPEPKTAAEISKSLDRLRQDLAMEPSQQKADFFRRMAESAKAYCEPGSFVREFLRGAAEADDSAMRAAVKRLVTENKDAVVEYHARAANSSMHRGEPSSIKKVNGWSYKYDESGELESVFEGDVVPLFLQ
jgi:hypothetical protein